MEVKQLIDAVKKRPDFHKVGMILCHNGVVRGTSRDGRKVSGLRVSVDQDRLQQIIEIQKQHPGIVDIRVEIDDTRDLSIGDDVMILVVAGDIRDTVIKVLHDTLNEIKTTVTSKTEFFV